MENSDLTIYRNPNLIISRVDDGFYAVMNPFIDNGIKVINKAQKTFFDSVNGKDTIHTIADKMGCSEKDLLILMDILKEKQFVSYDNSFQQPRWTKNINSINLWIQTTNECNLRCPYCYIHTLGEKDFISENVIDHFIDKLVETAKKWNLKFINLRFAGGEPFLKISLWKFKIPEMRQKLYDIDCELNVVILTNLVALNDELIEFIKINSIRIAVSMDGVRDYHNKTRHFKNGKGSFDIVNNNIDKLLKSNISPTIMTVVSNNNIDGLEEFSKYIIEKNLKHRFSFVSGEDVDILKMICKLKNCYEQYEKAIEKGYGFSSRHKLCDLKFDKLSFQTCSNGYNGGAVNTDGGVYFCQRHFGVTQPLGTIYDEDDLLSIIQRKTFFGTVSSDCESCVYRYICTSGCPIERVDKKDPHCLVYKELIPIILRLRGKERILKIKQSVAD